MGYAQIEINTPFSRDYQSVSSIKLAEKCLLAYKRRYIDGIKTPTGEAGAFGKLLHRTNELAYLWVEAEEYVGKLPDEVIIREYRRAFEESGVSGELAYNEGIKLVRSYFRVHDRVDHATILGIERTFTLFIEADDGSVTYVVTGVIDRIDRTGPTSIRIVDYKTNRMLFVRDELDTDLQMSVYGMAAKAMWPWVTDIEYAFDMMRHDIRQRTRRTDAQLNESADYIIAMTRRLESTLEFVPTLNPLCAWCDYRHDCEEYNIALRQGETMLSYLVATGDMEKVAAERDRCNALEKIAKKRRAEMDDIIRAHLSQQPDGTKLVIGDTRYMLSQGFHSTWPLDKTVKTLAEGLGLPEEMVRGRIVVVEKDPIEKLIKQANLPKAKKQLLEAKLDAIVRKEPKRPWVNARNIKQRKA